MDQFTSIAAFVRTVEAGSFAGAAGRLHVSASAVGKSVARLEARLGVRLLQRSTRRLSLTADGEHFFARCRRVLDELEDAEASMAAAAAVPRGRLRLSLPTIGYRFLLPVLGGFLDRHPAVELDLDFNDRVIDLLEGGFDAAIRGGDLADSQLMSRRLGGFHFVLCAAPAYLARRGVPAGAAELPDHACLRFRYPTTGKLQPWSVDGLDADALDRRAAGLTCSNMEAVRGAAVAGLGIGFMPDFLARDAVGSGALRIVLPGVGTAGGQFWLVWPSSRHLSPKLRAFADHCAATLFR